MRYLVLSDIHANLEALEACVTDGRRRGYDRALVLGDIVGYGPNPNEVVDAVRRLEPLAIVRGNHDKVASGLDSSEGFNVVARAAAKWTREVLTAANREWVASLPVGPTVVDALVEICHGSPFDEDAYVFDELDAVRALKTSTRPLCLFGHTHYPIAFAQSGANLETLGSPTDEDSILPLRDEVKYLLNPGSVGQPRDGDARAACAIVDVAGRRVELLRLPYRVETTQAKIAAAGLPSMLGDRLAVGR